VSSEGIANSRQDRAWWKRWRNRPRFRWSPLELREDTARTLPVIIPVVILGAIGIVAAVASLIADPPGTATFVGVAGLLAAATLAEAFPLPIEGVKVGTGTTSLAIVAIVSTGVIYGWQEAAVVGFLTMALVELGRGRRPSRIVFNTGMYVCAGILAGLAASIPSGDDLWAIVFASCLGSLAFYVVDMFFLSAVIARAQGKSYVDLLRTYVYATALPLLVMASLVITLVVLWSNSPWISIVVIGPLITVALHERWLHRALERLREFDRLKDEFIAVISHELRTPLTSVYGAALTLQKQDVDDEMRETLLDIVSDEAGRLARLLDRALSASRLDANRETFDIDALDGVSVARTVVDAAKQRLPPLLQLELTFDADVPRVLADGDKLRQVLVNLTENAIKYSPEGGQVDIRVARAGEKVRFSVRDQGIGIPLDQQAHVFDRFHRLDPNMTRGVGGLGLGLYICHQLVERMHGRIWVTSREGVGSTFTFELPAATENAA
jgi:signal transduction histidine kinase